MRIPFFTTTSAPVQTAMLVEMIRLLQQCQQMMHDAAMPKAPEMTEQQRKLQELGFTNTVEMQQWQQKKKAWRQQMGAMAEANGYKRNLRRSVEILIDARQTYGDDTLLIPYGDFERLMRKYNLVCGPFKAYKGRVPLSKMADIARLKNQPAPHYINRLFHVSGYRVLSSWTFGGIPEYLVRFPYTKSGDTHGRDLHDQPQYDWDNLGYELKIGAAEDFFICAPAKDMEKMHRVYSIRSASDPFVCAHTDCGILVFTRWGEEADDEVVRMYEQASRWLDRAKEFINSQPQRRGGFID